MGMLRAWILGLLAVGIWCLSVYGTGPSPLPANAPATEFSAARADAALARLLGPQKPHPASSAENDALTARLMDQLRALGLSPAIQTATSCESGRFILCTLIHNVVVLVTGGNGPAVLLMAHKDSVVAGPGAGDDASGVATILETIRAFKARAGAGLPVMALFTDGEELGLLGARAWLAAPHPAIAAVVNMEARGTRGPSLLFQTSAGDAALIDLYARNVRHPATSSLYGEIYRRLPNDTDLTPFLKADTPGVNFAFLGNLAQYHTPLDRRENIDLRSLQQHGENALAMVEGLRGADPASLKSGDAIYLDILGWWLPRLPMSWALPLSVLCLLMIALAGLLGRHTGRGHAPVAAFLAPPLLLAACVVLGFALHGLAALISGSPDPSLANPLWLRLSLMFGVWSVALLGSRWAGAIASWLWLAGLAVAASIWAPGVTPYFLFPSLVAAPLLLLTLRGWRGPALVVAALAAMTIWIGFVAGGEDIMGLRLHPLFTVPAAMALIAMLPLLRSGSNASAALLSLLAALGLAVTAGLQPTASQAEPAHVTIRYAGGGAPARWVVDSDHPLSAAMRAAGKFSAEAQTLLDLGIRGTVAPAPTLALDGPRPVLGADGGVTLQGAGSGDGLAVSFDKAVQDIRVNDVTVAAPSGPALIFCSEAACRIAFQKKPGPLRLTMTAVHPGLPQEAASLVTARGDAVPSGLGDSTFNTVTQTLN
jgi:hypothetical protein